MATSASSSASHALIARTAPAVGDRGAPVIHIGDLCDRGPDTKGVIDFLLAGRARGEPWLVVRGNHDRMMSMFLDDYPREDAHLLIGMHWLHPRVGGEATLAPTASRSARSERRKLPCPRARAAIPEPHRAFLTALPS